MAAKKPKFYVVWKGRERGVYDNWEDCKKQTHGYANPAYKSFESREEAMAAFAHNSGTYIGQGSKDKGDRELSSEQKRLIGSPIKDSICVDGAWNTATGRIEYQGVYFATGQGIFRQGPFDNGTNNIA
jgi:ribonuclease HI